MISNPRSHGNRQDAAWLHPDAPELRDVTVAMPETLEALHDTLRDFAAAGVDLLVVHGGDGTLRDVLTALPAAYPAALPHLALIPAGNTNLAARSLGSAGSGRKGLARLRAAAASGRLHRRQRPFLQIEWIGQPERPTLRGLLLGAAGFAAGKQIADASIHRRGLHSGIAVGLTTALTLLRALFGAGGLTAGSPATVAIDDAPARDGKRLVVLATTLDRLMLGLWPFWGDGAGDIRWLDVDASPPALLRAAFHTLVGRPRPWMAAHYRSGRARHLRIRLDRPFVLDGEFFDPGPEGILVSSPDAITVVAP